MIPNFLLPGECLERIGNESHPTVLITFGEDFNDVDHCMILHNNQVIDSWYKKYTIRSRPLDQSMVFLFRLEDIYTLLDRILPKTDCQKMKIVYWIL